LTAASEGTGLGLGVGARVWHDARRLFTVGNADDGHVQRMVRAVVDAGVAWAHGGEGQAELRGEEGQGAAGDGRVEGV
jgi:hypothetical protein